MARRLHFSGLSGALRCLVLAAFASSPAFAQTWSSTDWQSPQGLRAASTYVQIHEFALEISCDARAEQSYEVRVMFSGPALPRLYGTDGQQERLLLSFDGSSHSREWDVYYYDGGLGDQAWIGMLHITQDTLNALSAAQAVTILNTDQELIYRFPATGTFLGVRRLKDACGLGNVP